MKNPVLGFMGSKLFKSCAVVDACWSPHLLKQSLVLLESGDLFLFDLDVTLPFTGKRLKVSWERWSSLGKKAGGWLGCDYSWHPEIVVVAHSQAVFLLDFRMGQCCVTCLLEIDTAATYTPPAQDRFVAFSKAGSDRHFFVVSSEHRIVLFDVCKALIPLLQWEHGITGPSYINVFPLSQLGVYPKDDDHFKGSTEFDNSCILVGSFWNCEFKFFGYRPESKITKCNNSLCALDIPSGISLSGRECTHGSCLVREEFWKDSLERHIDWRQNKDIVLGFGLLEKELHTELSEQAVGFTLIRLMSSSKIELQRYIPSLDFGETIKGSLKRQACDFQDSLPFTDSESESKFRKKFHYEKLDYLIAYMKDSLGKTLFEKVKQASQVPCQSDHLSSVEFHKSVCGKVRTRRFNRSSDVLTDVRSMSSIHEITLSKIWTHLPIDLLRMAFSYASQLPGVSLDQKNFSLVFLEVPKESQDPPFVFRQPSCRNSKLPQNVCPGTTVVGPILSTPLLLTVNELRKGQDFAFSVNSEIESQCKRILKGVNEVATSGSGPYFGKGKAVSLGDNKDETFKDNSGMTLIALQSSPEKYESATKDVMSEDPVCYDEKFTTLFARHLRKRIPESELRGMGQKFSILCHQSS